MKTEPEEDTISVLKKGFKEYGTPEEIIMTIIESIIECDNKLGHYKLKSKEIR